MPILPQVRKLTIHGAPSSIRETGFITFRFPNLVSLVIHTSEICYHMFSAAAISRPTNDYQSMKEKNWSLWIKLSVHTHLCTKVSPMRREYVASKTSCISKK